MLGDLRADEFGGVRLFNADCLAVLPTLDGIDAVITDPPYGMNWDTDTTRFSGGQTTSVAKRGSGKNDGKRIAGDDRPFDPSPWLGFPRVVLFGFHHFASRLPVGSVLVWVKRNDDAFGSFLSDAELAWMKGGHGVYLRRDLSIKAEASRQLHHSQKPVGLMRWCLQRAKVQPGMTVLDPYMGSGTTGLACLQAGANFVGVELDPTHYATALKRLRQADGQGGLFEGVPSRQLTIPGEG